MPRPTWGETAEALIDLASDVALTKEREREINSIVARCSGCLYGDALPAANADVDPPLCERTIARLVSSLRRRGESLASSPSCFEESAMADWMCGLADGLESGKVEL